MPLKDLVFVDATSPPFLERGGHMGARIRAFPWHTHPLGNPEHWPAALRVTVRSLLTTSHPLLIFWRSGYYCFYNDAYARSIGPEKGATMLGDPARECWHHRLTLNLPAGPVLLPADLLRLSQVLSNLLINAAKYSDPGGHIVVAGAVEGDSLALSVKDDGIGYRRGAQRRRRQRV